PSQRSGGDNLGGSGCCRGPLLRKCKECGSHGVTQHSTGNLREHKACDILRPYACKCLGQRARKCHGRIREGCARGEPVGSKDVTCYQGRDRSRPVTATKQDG